MDIISVPTTGQDESNQRRINRVIGVAIRALREQYMYGDGVFTFYGFTSQVATTLLH